MVEAVASFTSKMFAKLELRSSISSECHPRSVLPHLRAALKNPDERDKSVKRRYKFLRWDLLESLNVLFERWPAGRQGSQLAPARMDAPQQERERVTGGELALIVKVKLVREEEGDAGAGGGRGNALHRAFRQSVSAQRGDAATPRCPGARRLGWARRGMSADDRERFRRAVTWLAGASSSQTSPGCLELKLGQSPSRHIRATGGRARRR